MTPEAKRIEMLLEANQEANEMVVDCWDDKARLEMDLDEACQLLRLFCRWRAPVMMEIIGPAEKFLERMDKKDA